LEELSSAIAATDKCWVALGLSKTSKHHAWLHHPLKQHHALDGFGDMLKDDAEQSHQDGDKFAK